MKGVGWVRGGASARGVVVLKVRRRSGCRVGGVRASDATPGLINLSQMGERASDATPGLINLSHVGQTCLGCDTWVAKLSHVGQTCLGCDIRRPVVSHDNTKPTPRTPKLSEK